MRKVTRAELRPGLQARADSITNFADQVDEDDYVAWGAATVLYCLHCGQSFIGSEVLYDAADGLLVCPVAGCEGNPGDWSTVPWE
jgi:hypothetical protein